MAHEQQFRYLNLAGRWPQIEQKSGLSLNPDGSLTLARVPGAAEIIGEIRTAPGLPAEPAGVASDLVGNVYISDPAANCIFKLNICDGTREPLHGLCAEEGEAGRLKAPRGLLIGPHQTLFVADSANHRIQIIDLHTGQLLGLWGQPTLGDVPQPGAGPGQFNQPWDLAADSSGAVYVVERAGQRVQKFDPQGHVIPTFWGNLSEQVSEPAYITATVHDSKDLLYLVDLGSRKVLVLDPFGAVKSFWRLPDWLLQPVGILVLSGAVYLGAPSTKRLLVFDLGGHFVGATPDYCWPVAALGLGFCGSLLVYPGGGSGVVRMRPDQSFVFEGSFLAGPYDSGREMTEWHRLRCFVEPLPSEASIELFTYTSDSEVELGPNPGRDPFPAAAGWQAFPPNVLDGLIMNPPGRYLWIGGRFQGNARVSPKLVQMQVTYPPDTYLRYLPAIYQRDEQKGPFLERLLALFESVLGGLEEQIGDLPLLFDPFASPTGWVPWLVGWQQEGRDEQLPDWLPWLASWLGFELDETWSELQTREAIAEAFYLHGRRGTVSGLRRMIELYAGVDALIEEPGRFSALWSLGETSTLGFDTILAPGYEQGAVLDMTATLDGSHLGDREEEGPPLFEDIAHHFCVLVYRAQMRGPETLAKVKAVLDREKPAHTDYHVCVIEPRFRVGFQGRIGIDAIVAGPAKGLNLGENQPLGHETVIASADSERMGIIGRQVRLGRDTTLI